MLSRTHFYCSLTVWPQPCANIDIRQPIGSRQQQQQRVEKSSNCAEEVSFAKSLNCIKFVAKFLSFAN